jgi:hypothetical protein
MRKREGRKRASKLASWGREGRRAGGGVECFGDRLAFMG